MAFWVTRNRWKSGIIVLLIAFILALPYLVQQLAQKLILDYAKPYGIQQVQLSKVDLNPLKGVVQIHDLQLFQKADTEKAVAQIGLLGVNLDVISLFQQRIWIESLSFENARLPFELNQDQALFLAGIPLSSKKSDATAKQKSSHFSFLPGLDNIDLKQIQISLHYQKQTTQFDIENLTLNALHAWSKEDYARLIIKSTLNQQPIKANLQLHLFADTPKIVGTLQAHGINLANFKHFVPQSDLIFNGNLNSNITFTLEQSKQGIKLFQQGEIALQDIQLIQDENQAKIRQLGWKGDLYLTQPTQATGDTKIALNGLLQADAINLNQAPFIAQIQQIALNGQSQIQLGETLHINSNKSLSIKGLEFRDTSQAKPLEIAFKQANLNGKFTLNKSQETQITLAEKLNLKGLQLDDANQKMRLNTDISATLNNQISLNENGLALTQNGGVELTNLSAHQAQLEAQLNQLNWQGALNLKNHQAMALDSKGKLEIADFSLANRQQNLTIAKARTLNIAELNIINLKDIGLQDIRLQGLAIAQNKKLPGLLAVSQIQLNNAHYQEQNKAKRLTLGNLAIRDSETHLSVTQDNKITQLETLLAALAESADTPKPTGVNKQTAVAEAAQNPEAPFHYSLASIKLSGNNPVHVTLEQTKPALKKTLKLEQFALGRIASQQPQKTSDFSLKVAFDEFSRLSSKGDLTPLQPTKHFYASSNLDGLALNDLSPLVEQKLGYKIESGQLSAKLTTKIDNNTIDAKNDIKLNKFKIKSVDNQKTQAIEKGFPVPLQAGLSLLQDKNDNIALSLPIQGDLNNPSFKIHDVINTALGKALAAASRTYLLLALQPFGAIALVGQYALDKGSNITLQAVDFTPGTTTLSAEMQAYLNKLNKLLTERRKIQIKLCEGASERDRFALKQQALEASIKQQSEQKNNQKIVVPDIEISNKELLKLAEERQKVIKRHLMNLGTSNNQIILCDPVIGKDDQKSQVKLSI
ncbi:hypothetical protein THMIRHAM_01790 [Thiomicrorhabdus immobilis]|uniref:DUF748 domain-containing protein n=1 Tax=Thiomicrorhabdus immobilis TaxID=2791037 RepID=A0ABM7MAM2_9GAMM|nr:DUF748 domain-containing protein [Thiomicrorhabdus immobilis]BCN92394.1 hypothetical protein THMIRHAM_01790 [Thiomicrorhabdus immobilis]